MAEKKELTKKEQQIENTKKLIAGINKAREQTHNLAHGIPVKKAKKKAKKAK